MLISDDLTIKLNEIVWKRGKKVEVTGTYAERYVHEIIFYICYSGLKTDWIIEKREDTFKPYLLREIGSGHRHGCFDKLSSAKISAYLIDFG
jgi:hypothetical protein